MLSDDFARRFVELSNDLICSFTPDGHVDELNPRWQDLLGFTLEELRSRPWTAFVHPDDVPSTAETLRLAWEGRPVPGFENRVVTRDGTVHTLLWGTALAEEEHRVLGLAKDVTDRRRREDELERSGSQLRRMTRAALEISSAISVGSALEATAAAAREVIRAGVGQASLADRYPDWTGLDRLVLERQAPLRLTQQELEAHPQWRGQDDPGIEGWLAAPLVGKHGDTLGLVQVSAPQAGGFTADDEQLLVHLAHIASATLERLDLEERFLQAQRVEAVGRLAAGIIHDFNNTLAVMLVRSELLQSSVTEPDVAEHAAELHAAARAAADVARDLLALSRTDSEEGRTPAPEPSDIAEIVREVARLAKPMLGGSIGLELALADEPLPTLLGKTDLHQVLMNLVLNARDAIDGSGTIAIEARAEDDHILLRVRDDGVGMAPDTRARIFTPYFTTKADRGGTGLGLAGVQTIITRAGGRIGVESEPARGSVFTLHVPHAERSSAVVPSPASRALPGGDEPVAVLGRNRSVVAVLEALLDSLGYAVAPSRPGRDPDVHGAALVVVEGHEPATIEHLAIPADAVVLHVTGPDCGPSTPSGDLHVLQRPVSADQLARTVRRILDEREQRLQRLTARDERMGARRRAADVHPSSLDG